MGFKTQNYDNLSRKIYSELARNPNRALTMAETAILAARTDGSREGLAKMVLCRAHAHREIGNYNQSVKDYDRASSLFKENRQKIEAARTTIGKMDALDQLERYSQALRIGALARRIFRQAKLPLFEARVNANSGNIYHHL